MMHSFLASDAMLMFLSVALGVLLGMVFERLRAHRASTADALRKGVSPSPLRHDPRYR